MDGIGFPVLQGDQGDGVPEGGGQALGEFRFWNIPKNGQGKGIDGVLHVGGDEDDLPWGRWGRICSAISMPVHPGISMSSRMRSKKKWSWVMSYSRLLLWV